jgi:hypothetical protein
MEFCCSAALWTYAGIRSGLRKSGKPQNRRIDRADLTATFLFSAVLSALVLGSGNPAASSFELLSASRRIVQQLPLVNLPELNATRASAKRRQPQPDARVMPLATGVPGVIFRPEVKLRPNPAVGYPPGTPVSFLRTVTFPFTGEYYVFPTSNGHIGMHSEVVKGTPLDSRYQSLGGGTVETEAYQKLTPPVEFSDCRAIEMTLSSAEVSPASASMQLIVDGRVQDLGIEIFGLESTTQEKLTFVVPPLPRDRKVEAIRIVFNRDPSARHQTVKVAIRSFTLLARI